MEVNSGNRNELKEKQHSETMNFLVKNLNDISSIIRLIKTNLRRRFLSLSSFKVHVSTRNGILSSRIKLLFNIFFGIASEDNYIVHNISIVQL